MPAYFLRSKHLGSIQLKHFDTSNPCSKTKLIVLPLSFVPSVLLGFLFFIIVYGLLVLLFGITMLPCPVKNSTHLNIASAIEFNAISVKSIFSSTALRVNLKVLKGLYSACPVIRNGYRINFQVRLSQYGHVLFFKSVSLLIAVAMLIKPTSRDAKRNQ